MLTFLSNCWQKGPAWASHPLESGVCVPQFCRGIWAAVHIQFLAQSNLRVSVFLQWVWLYFTGQRGSRLIVDYHRPEYGKASFVLQRAEQLARTIPQDLNADAHEQKRCEP